MNQNENQTITLSDGRKLGYAEYGDPKGKPVFYFHGWPSSRLGSKMIDEIAKKTHVRLISIDRPGYGLSIYKENRQILDWPNDVLELANKLKLKKFAIMGVSGGGPYAAVCAYKISKRLTKVGIIVGLGPTWIPGVFDGMSFVGSFLWSHYAKYPLLRFSAGLNYYILGKYFPVLFAGYIFLLRSKADKKASILLLKNVKTKSLLANSREIFRQGLKGPVLDLYLYTKDWGFNLKDIKADVYLFYGDADKNVSLNMGKYYHSQIPGSILKIYPNEGHLVSITHAEEILKTLIS